MRTIEIMTTNCPRVLCDPPPSGVRTFINTLTGEAECDACNEEWTYGQLELLEILNNLED